MAEITTTAVAAMSCSSSVWAAGECRYVLRAHTESTGYQRAPRPFRRGVPEAKMELFNNRRICRCFSIRRAFAGLCKRLPKAVEALPDRRKQEVNLPTGDRERWRGSNEVADASDDDVFLPD